jgi:hypothetical protein
MLRGSQSTVIHIFIWTLIDRWQTPLQRDCSKDCSYNVHKTDKSVIYFFTPAPMNARENAALAGQVYNSNLGFALVAMLPGTQSILTIRLKVLQSAQSGGLESKLRFGFARYIRPRQDGHPRWLRHPVRSLERGRLGPTAIARHWLNPSRSVHQPTNGWHLCRDRWIHSR